MTACLILGCTVVAAWQYFVIYKDSHDLEQNKLGVYPKLSVPTTQTNGTLLAECSDNEAQLGYILVQSGQYSNALSDYERGFELNSNSIAVLNNFAWLRATAPDSNVRNGPEAVALAERACQLTEFGEPHLMATLTAAYAEDGRFNDAIVTAQKAIALAQRSGETNLVERNKQLLQIYISRKPYHEPELVPSKH